MIIVSEAISLAELMKMAEERFGNMVKAVIDIDKEIIAINAELHADEEAALLGSGSKQGNRTRGVDSPEIRQKIIEVVNKRMKK